MIGLMAIRLMRDARRTAAPCFSIYATHDRRLRARGRFVDLRLVAVRGAAAMSRATPLSTYTYAHTTHADRRPPPTSRAAHARRAARSERWRWRFEMRSSRFAMDGQAARLSRQDITPSRCEYRSTLCFELLEAMTDGKSGDAMPGASENALLRHYDIFCSARPSHEFPLHDKDA